MANFKVQCKKIAFVALLILIKTGAAAQNDSTIRNVVSNLITTDNKRADLDSLKNVTFILFTDRMCERCFNDVCIYLSRDSAEHNIHVIYFTEKDVMKLLSVPARFRTSVSCAKNFYFFWTNKTNDPQISKIFQAPSPQMIMVKEGSTSYISYKETIKRAYPK